MVAGTPLYLDEWIEKSSWIGFARVCILLDISKKIYLKARVKVNDSFLWQQFTYKKLPKLCYFCGKMGQTMKSCNYKEDRGLNTKPVYSHWIHAAKVSVELVHSQEAQKIILKLWLVVLLQMFGLNLRRWLRDFFKYLYRWLQILANLMAPGSKYTPLMSINSEEGLNP